MITQEKLKELLYYNPATGVFYWISDNKWGKVAGHINNCRGKKYNCISHDNEIYRAHRLAWLYVHGFIPPDEVDHIDGDSLNNRLENLRCVTHVENQRNMKLSAGNKSGCTGVYWHKKDKRWLARIVINGKQLHLGTSTEWWDAVCARKSAENKYGFHPNHGSERAG